MRWAGHVALMGEERKVYRFRWENPKKRDHLEDKGLDGRMKTEWTLGTLAGGWRVDPGDSELGQWRTLVNTVMNLRVLVLRS
jgi:hypothetical protein